MISGRTRLMSSDDSVLVALGVSIRLVVVTMIAVPVTVPPVNIAG
jgi:hypothetical protein